MLRIYNTLSRTKENFKPLNDNEVTLYSCGPTVYSTPHIGNMRAYTFVDTLVRTLNVAGYNVNNVINITDVGHLTSDADEGEDKLEKAAKNSNKNAYYIAKEYTDIFFKYLELLNIQKPKSFPKATEYIQEQIDMIKELQNKGFVYLTKDGVYFNTVKFEKYSELANINIEGLRKGERVAFGDKINETDFALWKFSGKTKRQMEWDSPWGIGFPGWHIECSAMAKHLLGEQIDIHTGGIDHIPIHHTNEIAQSEALSGKSFSQYWMHVNFLQLLPEGETEFDEDAEIKMSKSKGTAFTVDQIIEHGFDPMVLKFLYLSAHYRNELKFNFTLLKSAENTFNKMQTKAYEIKKLNNNKKIILENNSFTSEFLKYMFDDLNTPKAISYIHQVLNNETDNDKKYNFLISIDEVLGLNLLKFEPKKDIIPKSVILLAEHRIEARRTKNWLAADDYRSQIEKKGFEIKDTPEGYDLTKK